MSAVHLRSGALALFLLASGCGDEATAPDAGATVDASSPRDAGPKPDAGAPDDAGADDAAVQDAGADDAGATGRFELRPGAGLSWPGGQVMITADTFADVRGRLGPGARDSGQGTRSYTWSLSAGFELTVWFANTNLDGDDAAPADVDDTDRVLWAAVRGGFGGQTPEGVGLGSTRAEVEAAYGAAPALTAVDTPPGSLAAYYDRGLLVTYGTDAIARTVTVSRSYPTHPGGSFDLSSVELELPSGRLRGSRGIAAPGSSRAEIEQVLGAPDGVGTLQLGRANLTTWSYGFFGLELFFLGSSDNLLFLTVHAPYYGTSGQVRLGSARAEVETLLASEGYPSGTPSSTNAQLICYGSGTDQVGVTYDADGAATSFTFRLLTCP